MIKSNNALTSVFMIVALFIMTIFSLQVAKPFLLPIVFGVFISLLCGPLVNYLVRVGIPRTINVLGVLIALVGIIAITLNILSEPAQEWWSKLPVFLESVSNGVNEVTQSDLSVEASSANSNSVSNGGFTNNTAFSIIQSLLTTTPTIVTQLLVALFMAYFMMNYGRELFAQSLTYIDKFSDKRKAVELVKVVQIDLSRYIGSITMINFGLGLVVGLVFWAMGLQDPFLWGAFAGLMNYIPYLGPMISVTCFALVALLQFESLSYSLTIAAIFLSINLVESQAVTPTLLGRRFSLNPLVLFVWLVFWGWVWGAMGMLIGVPLLVCLNVLFDRMEYFKR